MKTAKAVLYVLAVAVALAGFGWFFVSQLGSGRTDDLAGVLLSPPPGYAIVERGEMPAAAAAAELAEQALRPGAGRVGSGSSGRAGRSTGWPTSLETASRNWRPRLPARACGRSGRGGSASG